MKPNNIIEVVKATTHGEWLAEYQNGFKSKNKIHKNKKKYNRKNLPKMEGSFYNIIFFTTYK